MIRKNVFSSETKRYGITVSFFEGQRTIPSVAGVVSVVGLGFVHVGVRDQRFEVAVVNVARVVWLGDVVVRVQRFEVAVTKLMLGIELVDVVVRDQRFEVAEASNVVVLEVVVDDAHVEVLARELIG